MKDLTAMMLRTCALVALCTVLGASVSARATAQLATRAAAVDHSGYIVDILPNGTVQTIYTPPTNASWIGGSIRPNVTNRGLVVLHQEAMSASNWTTRVSEWDNVAGLTTIATLASAGWFPGVTDVVVDQDGDYIVANGLGVFRVNPVSATVSTLTTGQFAQLTHNQRAGGFTAMTVRGDWVDLTPGGAITTIVRGTTGAWLDDLRSDPYTGDLFHAAGEFRRFDRNTQSFTKIAPLVIQPNVLDVDPADRNFVIGGSWYVAKIDRAGAVLRTMWAQPPTPNQGLFGVTVVGSRHLAPLSPATGGSTYQLLVSFPLDAGAPYLVAASLGFTPGIPTPQGAIPLQPDALFGLSMNAPQLFQGFAGVLSPQGEASATIRLPRSAKGVRFYLAAITVPNGTIGGISAPLGVTIR